MEQDKDVDAILQRNLLRIIEERFSGNQAAFCRALGFNPTYINAVVRGKKNLGKPNWEKIRKALDLRSDEFLQEAESPIVRDKDEQLMLDWFREIRSAGMIKEAEAMMEYLSTTAKKKDGAGREGKTSRVPRRSLKRAG